LRLYKNYYIVAYTPNTISEKGEDKVVYVGGSEWSGIWIIVS